MIFEQFYLGCLAHASYLIGSDGVAAVIDPQRDVEIYIETAKEKNLAIRHVIETHLHADFVSGHVELAERTGARIYLGPGSGAAFPHVTASDGFRMELGKCLLEFLETPGHTLESISIVLTDLEQSDRPIAVFTGDTLFVGDVGRPDLAESHTPQELASLMYDSLFGKLLRLPGDVAVYPAHGAGSLCGRNISQERSSTIAREIAANYSLQARDRDDFVRMVTADLPTRREYFLRDVELNRQGAGAVASLPAPAPLDPPRVIEMQKEGAVVLDTRSAIEFAGAHIPGSLHIGAQGQFASWAATLIGLNSDVLLVAEDFQQACDARVRLARVGIERVAGYIRGGIGGWAGAGYPLEQIPQMPVQELARQHQEGHADLVLIDVRTPSEWQAGNIAFARNLPLDQLAARLGELDRDCLLAVHCQGGYRSSTATSILRRGGFRNISNVTGGYQAWQALYSKNASSASAG